MRKVVGLEKEGCVVCLLKCVGVNVESEGVRCQAQEFFDCEVCEASRLASADLSNRNNAVITHLGALSDPIIQYSPSGSPVAAQDFCP